MTFVAVMLGIALVLTFYYGKQNIDTLQKEIDSARDAYGDGWKVGYAAGRRDALNKPKRARTKKANDNGE